MSIVVPYVDINAKVTNFFPFCTIGISMYQKSISSCFILWSVPDRQKDRLLHLLLPKFFFAHWAHGALPAGATLIGWPNYGVDGRMTRQNTPPVHSAWPKKVHVQMLVTKLEWTPYRFWDSSIWNIDKYLPIPIWGSPFQYGVPNLNAVPIRGRNPKVPNWNGPQTASG